MTENERNNYIQTLKQMISMLETMPVESSLPRASSFRKMLPTDLWPNAVEDRLILKPGELYGREVLHFFLEREIEDRKFLHLGCGDGSIAYAALDLSPRLAVGYDIHLGEWDRFSGETSLRLTDDLSLVRDCAPYDAILIYDILDHVNDPVNILLIAEELLADSGLIYCRCHPFCSRHGANNWNSVNKAYCHLFFPPEELNEIGIKTPTQKVLRPLETYRSWIHEARLVVRRERQIWSPIEKFFHSPASSKKLKTVFQTEHFPEEFLRITFADYTLKKVP